MSVRSAGRGRAAARSIRLALRSLSIVATKSASWPRWVFRCRGSRCASSASIPAASRSIPLIPIPAQSITGRGQHARSTPSTKLMDGKTPWLRIARCSSFAMRAPGFPCRHRSGCWAPDADGSATVGGPQALQALHRVAEAVRPALHDRVALQALDEGEDGLGVVGHALADRGGGPEAGPVPGAVDVGLAAGQPVEHGLVPIKVTSAHLAV